MTRRAATRFDLVWLAVILAGHAVIWSVHPFAHLDDLDSQHYARLAAELLAGDFEFASHPFNDRFGVTVPSAALYAVFGVSARTIALWPLCASLLSIAAVYLFVLRSFGRSSARLAALLLATNPVQVEYAAHLLPDIIASAFMLISMGLLLEARDPAAPGPRPALCGALSTLFLFAGFLSKTTVIWAFPFLFGLLLVDLTRRRHLRLWASVLVTGFACIGLFLAGYQVATGDPLHALGSIEGSHNVSVASFDGKDPTKLAYRLKWAPIHFLGRQLGYASLIVLAVPGLIHLLWPRPYLPRELRLWAAPRAQA